ncbi:MAG: apolipoprotein N-acyltransferase [Pirellulaceae bacterium]|nr:apolipoprotein N-acyltransferase [Pirellulaceae bacterium]
MNRLTTTPNQVPTRQIFRCVAAAAVLQWLSQPPLALAPVAAIAIVPWLMIISISNAPSRRGYWTIWGVGAIYWLVSLQGLRHAHPAIYVGWFALAAYLSVYGVLFVAITRRMIDRHIPIWIAAPVSWVGLECVRNYFATGISAIMLGHTMADVAMMTQIADTFGTYGVSFVLVSINVAAFTALNAWRRRNDESSSVHAPWVMSLLVAAILTVATLIYGTYRLGENRGDELATFALIQRSEHVEYVPDEEREIRIFNNYVRQSLQAVSAAQRDVDAIVWPESMLSGGRAWMIADKDATPPEQFGGSLDEFQLAIDYQQTSFLTRIQDVQQALAAASPDHKVPHLIGGCGVVRYRDIPHAYSGIVHVDSDGELADWYGKTHLVMLGEYVPLVQWIPGLQSILPPGLGLATGAGPKRMMVGETSFAPNICIETAVERVTVNHLSQLHAQSKLPDAVITVTNDGWFDDSSVIDHHLRCAQLVAVGCRRPVLSAANNGPTAWIDSNGKIVESLATGSDGAVIATPLKDPRISNYLFIGDWPARLLALISLILLVDAFGCWWRQRRARRSGAGPSSLGVRDEPLGTSET